MSRSAEPYIQIRINRNVSIAAIVSLLVHVLILFLLSYYDLLKPNPPTAEQEQSLDVTLELPPPTEAPKESVIKPRTQSKRIKIAKAPPVSEPVPTKETPIVPAAPSPVPPTPAPQATPPKAIPPKPTPAAPEKVTEKYPDMASYMAAAKERRRLAGDPSAINEAAAAHESAEEATRVASLRRPPSGTNGIFNIISWDSRNIVFDFRGWKNEFSYARREVYAVDADRNTTVEHAMVRKMIEIIRRYYYGDNSDFNWTSQRLGQVVSLSARPQDNAFLEDFLMQEFFGSRGIVPR
ncbi:MAG: hypothetical protein ACKVN9_01805 [Methylophilaceae bacterium]